MSLIIKLALGKPIVPEDLVDNLYEICDREHSSCNVECPVFFLNGNKIPEFIKAGSCDTFKNGTAMLDFIRNHPVPLESLNIDLLADEDREYPQPKKEDFETVYPDGTKLQGGWSTRLKEWEDRNLHRIPKGN